MEQVDPFARERGVAVQAWAAFGMDAVVWLCGTEGAILLAMDHPKAFGELMEIVTETDLARVELAVRQPGIDLIVERGWYSSTEFWSPQLFDRYLLKHVQRLAELSHRHGKKFCYTVTTGVEILGPRLADAGVDVLYFIDPLLDGIRMDRARDLLSSRICLVGGANAITLATKNRKMIQTEVLQAMDCLGPSARFILHPIDALFPDTPWEGVEMLIEAWEKAGSAGAG
jgi:uroporphyrinogen-III decarboxylase